MSSQFRSLLSLLLCILSAATLVVAQSTPAHDNASDSATATEKNQVAVGEVLIEFRAGASDQDKQAVLRGVAATPGIVRIVEKERLPVAHIDVVKVFYRGKPDAARLSAIVKVMNTYPGVTAEVNGIVSAQSNSIPSGH
jgi:hypothetical protein